LINVKYIHGNDSTGWLYECYMCGKKFKHWNIENLFGPNVKHTYLFCKLCYKKYLPDMNKIITILEL